MQKFKNLIFFINSRNVIKSIDKNKNIFIKNMLADDNDGLGTFFIKLEIKVPNIF